MKIIIIASLICIIGCSSEPNNKAASGETTPSTYQIKMQNYQDSISATFASGANGVLLPEDVSPTTKIDYYAPNEDFKVKASFERIINGKVFEMKTSTDRLPQYRPFGNLHFKLGQDDLSLTLYQSLEYPEYLFCPYKDLTNGNETYGAGRYLDFMLEDTLDAIIDFNYSYNPLCAYNYKYSCPIPPIENHLKVRIEAGVKKWH